MLSDLDSNIAKVLDWTSLLDITGPESKDKKKRNLIERTKTVVTLSEECVFMQKPMTHSKKQTQKTCFQGL